MLYEEYSEKREEKATFGSIKLGDQDSLKSINSTTYFASLRSQNISSRLTHGITQLKHLMC
jgi:hypothetical protein